MERRRRSPREKAAELVRAAQALIRDAMQDAVDRPRPVRPRRESGPRLIPSDWYDLDQQAKVAPQCALCHERALPGMPPLVRGLCGVCRARLDETPDAA